MPAGEALRDGDRRAIRNAVEAAERTSGYHFSVLLEDSGDDPRAFACERHALLDDPERAVLVMVDPTARVLEIVTGRTVHRVLDDAHAALAAVAMQSWFATGDLVGGLVHGLQQLSEHARSPELLHYPVQRD
ncbi:MAG: DUF5130 family protein [Nocardioidaceae bacterium]